MANISKKDLLSAIEKIQGICIKTHNTTNPPSCENEQIYNDAISTIWGICWYLIKEND